MTDLPALHLLSGSVIPRPVPELPSELPGWIPDPVLPPFPMPERRREYIRPAYAERFACIGSACEDNCCKGWDVPIDQKTFQKYAANELLSPHLGTFVILNTAKPTVSDYARIVMNSEKACPFLDQEQLCGVQSALGHEMLSHTCATYPRVDSASAGSAEQALNLSCPEAARLTLLGPSLLGTTPFPAGSVEHYEPVRHDVWQSPVDYRPRLALREFVFLLLTDRSYPLWQRLYLLGVFTQRLQVLRGVTPAGEWCDRNPAAVIKFLGDCARTVENGSLRATMNRIKARPDLQLQWACEVLQGRVADPPVVERFMDCVRDFEAGLACNTATCEADILHSYQANYQLYYLPFMRRNPQLLENYLINLAIKSGFPFGRTGPQGSEVSSSKNLQNDLFLLCAHAALVQAMLIGIAGRYRESFSEAHVVKLIQALSKTFEHSHRAIDRITELLQAKDLKNLQGIAMMLQQSDAAS